MTIQETLNWIHSFKAFGRKVDLELMNWLLNQLHNPQKNFQLSMLLERMAKDP